MPDSTARTRSRLGLVVALAGALAAVTACGQPDAPEAKANGPLPSSVYDDAGPVPPEAAIHALVGMKVKDAAALDDLVRAVSEPGSPSFREFIRPADAIARFSPTDDDVAAARRAVETRGLKVARVSTNRLVLEVTGTVAQFNATFDTEVHLYVNKDASARTKSLASLYAPARAARLPRELATVARDVLAVDPAVEKGELKPESKVDLAMPDKPADGLVPAQIAKAYGFDALEKRGARVQGASLGLVVGASYKVNDAKAFWKLFGVDREAPIDHLTSDPPTTRVVESALDVQWAGALAPGAKLVIYTAPDIHETSLIYAFNEAIALGEVDVLSDSFAHRESSVSRAGAEQYETCAKLAAVVGMTVVAASGDSGGIDLPATAPHVTAVGGTQLVLDGDASREVVWNQSGSGRSNYFGVPAYQASAARGADGRVIADVALNAQTFYWVAHLGEWQRRGGTSFAAPVFAAMIAVIDGERRARGEPPLGFVNPVLYGDRAVQAAFRDVTEGATGRYQASKGWDYASGWGSPDGAALADALR